MPKDNIKDLDSASRLGSARKKRDASAKRHARTASATAVRWKQPGDSSSDPPAAADHGDKENIMPLPQDIPQSRMQENYRKQSSYWRGVAKGLRSDQKEKKAADKEHAKEEKRTEREWERKVKEKKRENEKLVTELEREKKRRRLDRDVYQADLDRMQSGIQDYQHQIHTLKDKVSRIPTRLATAANRLTRIFQTRADKETSFTLKDANGVIPDATRDVIADLVAVDGVPANKVTRVFKRITEACGIGARGDVSRRSVGRITKEAGNASKLQFVDALRDATGVTLSGDGTTHKNETLESKFGTVITEDKKIQFFLGIQLAVNHTSETQLAGWIESIEEFFHLAHESGMISDDDARVFWNLVTGFHSDHAADQKKLFELLKDWKQRLEREQRGERVVKGFRDLEWACLIFKGSQALVEKTGGSAAWDALPHAERERKIEEMKKQLIRDIGTAEFEKLSEEEKAEIDLFLWAGCCMHKDMNAFKGGCIGLEEFWKEHPDLTPPMLFPNRDNAATLTDAAGTKAADRAKSRTERGAIKLVNLAGMIFRHKDRKRGQQDTLRFYFDYKLGFILTFPDTSNTRFQSHAEACALVITHLELFIEFLTYVRHNKASKKLNYMEQNVFDGLNDIPTRHELCAITLYWLAISVPYMREIRGPDAKEDNILKLGELHHRVVEHIDMLIEHPEYLVGPDASADKGSLDGRAWERPDAFYAVQQRACNLPHLKVVLVHFLTSSRVVWLRFMSEFTEGGAIAKATSEQVERAWMDKTNDLNESAFGIYRQSNRRNPTTSLIQHNSRQMYKFNSTSTFLRSLSPEMRKWLRKITRKQDASGANRQEKIHMAEYRKQVSEAHVAKQAQREQNRQARAKAIDAVIPISTLTDLDYRATCSRGSKDYLKVTDINDQLKWHRKNGVKGAVPEKESMWGKGRENRLELLREVVGKYVELPATSRSDSEGLAEDEGDFPDVTVEDLQNYETDDYDSEEEYYI